jgi:hypothetical protein
LTHIKAWHLELPFDPRTLTRAHHRCSFFALQFLRYVPGLTPWGFRLRCRPLPQGRGRCRNRLLLCPGTGQEKTGHRWRGRLASPSSSCG